MMAVAYVALGTNMGNRQQNIDRALTLMAENGMLVLDVAPLMDNPPYGLLDQNDFLNTVVRVETGLSAPELLQKLLLIEKIMGRVRTRHWGPRIIDLDILLYGDRVIDLTELQIPHPDMANRDFVLEPLAAIAPQLIHPTFGITMVALRDDLRRRRSAARRGSDPSTSVAL